MTPVRVRDALRAASARLAAAGVGDPAREARWLLAHALGVPLSDPALLPDRPLPEEVAGAFWRAVERRAAREPLAYILGTQEFMGLTLRVTRDVLVPRADTAVLVEAAVEALREAFPGATELRVADVGTGSGCIAVAICRLLPQARVWATDVAPAALAVARENAASVGCAGRVTFLEGDLLDPLPPALRLHAIVSNPPYVAEDEWPGLMPEVREYEPRQALLAGPDGLAVIRRLVAGAPERLEPGGVLALEVGYRQAEAVLALLRARGLEAAARRDPAGHLRAVIGRLTGWPRRGPQPGGG
ncbi:peptide chain release factor N(5)-glutamine methyltransferase [Caldinitratiruptor microaerophilus]|uniref:Release factor glutamine methyltransferase n=1 Tax=Caldinitratiruptor microaerophilus TaxID=671077 RepID=A0AA35CPX0_9FIRM|nr:peptide chain release factor N(5)-glutamine methyltransferase [Caldinitratiruptor microaerophilus]BDG61781.1 release factor glutamine methyltransferase [Caldinitratiruptor microaerophilus]